jgi:hypothetical protein
MSKSLVMRLISNLITINLAYLAVGPIGWIIGGAVCVLNAYTLDEDFIERIERAERRNK